MFVLDFYKGGRKYLAPQFRPITLTSHLAKILEKAVRITVIEHLDLHDLMDPNQLGSRKGQSTLSQLQIHQAEILEGLIDRANVDNIYIDFSMVAYITCLNAYLETNIVNSICIKL